MVQSKESLLAVLAVWVRIALLEKCKQSYDIWLEVVGEISGKLFEPTISFPVKKVFEPDHAWWANMELLGTYVSLI